MSEPIKSSLKDFSLGDSFLQDVETKFKSGIQLGAHGFDLARDVEFNTEDTSVVRYIKGPKLKNLSGQYILIEAPDIAIGTFETATIYHDLKRVPNGVIIVEQAGVDKSAYPFSLQDVIFGIVHYRNSIQNWNANYFTLSMTKLAGGSFPCRMVLLVT